jgi:hypothetical protein
MIGDVKGKKFITIFDKSINMYYYSAYWTVVFVLICLSGIRWETGNDWQPYSSFFENNTTWTQFNFFRYELFYRVLNFIIKKICDSYTIFLLIFGFLTIYLKARFINSFALMPGLSIFLYFCLRFADIGAVRQDLAISFCLLSIIFISKRRIVYFLGLTLCAIFFHKSAILWLISYPVYYAKVPAKYIILFFIAGIFCGLNAQIFYKTILGTLLKPFGNYDTFLGQLAFFLTNDLPHSKFTLSLLKRIIIILLLLYCRKFINNEDNWYLNGFINLYFFGEILSIFFMWGGHGFQRLSTPFSMTEIIVIPNLCRVIRKKHIKYIFLFVILFYGLLKLWNGLESTKTYTPISTMDPYMSIFNYDPSIR